MRIETSEIDKKGFLATPSHSSNRRSICKAEGPERTVVLLQSSYIPWRGYFHLVNKADIFVFHDDLQYTHSDWRNRNKIKTASGWSWLTIPAGRNEKRLISEVEVDDLSWKGKHRRAIEQNYCKAPHFEGYAHVLDYLYANDITNLAMFNQRAIRFIATLLGISTTFLDSRTLNAKGQKTDRIVDIMLKLGATKYLSGPSARSYIEPGQFEAAGIQLEYITYRYPEYSQLYPPYCPQMSILDLLFMTGPEAPAYIWGTEATTPPPNTESSRSL
ncbi:MAG: WbqC family protein [Candidatus Nealsonbacteria bacterium]|nr:WbqC family protein [Candidatus Nealsonbacteria bacterium]